MNIAALRFQYVQLQASFFFSTINRHRARVAFCRFRTAPFTHPPHRLPMHLSLACMFDGTTTRMSRALKVQSIAPFVAYDCNSLAYRTPRERSARNELDVAIARLSFVVMIVM